MDNFNPEYLQIFSRDVLDKIKKCDDSWQKLVPEAVGSLIRKRGLFGYPLRRNVEVP